MLHGSHLTMHSYSQLTQSLSAMMHLSTATRSALQALTYLSDIVGLPILFIFRFASFFCSSNFLRLPLHHSLASRICILQLVTSASHPCISDAPRESPPYNFFMSAITWTHRWRQLPAWPMSGCIPVESWRTTQIEMTAQVAFGFWVSLAVISRVGL